MNNARRIALGLVVFSLFFLVGSLMARWYRSSQEVPPDRTVQSTIHNSQAPAQVRQSSSDNRQSRATSSIEKPKKTTDHPDAKKHGVEKSPIVKIELSVARDTKESYALAEQRFISSFREPGLFKYLYEPHLDSYPDKNNAIRQLMASRLLAELAQQNPELAELHRRNLAFLFDHWYRTNGEFGYVFYNGKSKLGANAMFLRTLCWSPQFSDYQLQAKQLADGIISLIDDRGAFQPWFKEPDYEYDADYLLTFYSGEALVALLEYANLTNDETCLKAAFETQDYYLNRYVEQIEENYYPAYVPWHTISLSMLWKRTAEAKYATAIFKLNDKLLELQDRTNRIGRFYNFRTPQYGTPHSSSDGVYTESLGYAYEIARLTGDQNRRIRYAIAIQLAVGNLRKLQYDEISASRFKRPEQLVGAIRISESQPGLRIDTTQHTMDAYRKIMNAFAENESW